MGFLNRGNTDAPNEILNWRLWYGVFGEQQIQRETAMNVIRLT